MIFPQQQETYNTMKSILGIFSETQGLIRPHFHLTGPSGSGKSFLLKQACDELQIKMMEVNAAGLTTEGLSGNSLSKALRPLREHWNEPNLIFVDEFDKLFQRNGETTEGFRSAVQDEFLMALESKYTSVFTDYGKYEPIRIDNSLFVFAGAYSNQKIETIQQLKDAGMRTEFVGRVPLVFMTKEVPVSELKNHIQKVKLFNDYSGYFVLDSKEKNKAATAIVNMLIQQNKELNIGIRLLNSCIHQYFIKEAE
jgi:ATP-dependent protease Clp ATPase subunit